MNPRYAAAITEWSQRWRDGDQSWVHERLGFNPDDFGVDRVDRRTAVDFILRHHYSRSVPALRKYRFGLFYTAGEQPVLCGVLVLSIPPRPEVLTGVFPHLVPYYESAEVGRMVLLDWPGHGAETWFFGEVRDWLAKNTDIRGLVMFSDPEPRVRNGKILLAGHAGTSYQASNAPCVGMSDERWITLINGLVFNDRSRQKILSMDQGWRYVAQMLEDEGADPFDAARDDPREYLAGALRKVGAQRRKHGGCYKYGIVVGVNARQRAKVTMTETRCPYPKLDLGQQRLF